MSAAATRVVRHAAREASADQVSFVASGVAFRVALAVFPAVALVVWLGSRLLSADEVRSFLQGAMQAVPDSTREIVQQAVSASMAKNPADRGGDLLGPATPLLGLGFTLWSANSGMRALFKALNLIFDVEERRGWLRFTGITLLCTLGTLVVLVSTMMLGVLVPHVLPSEGIYAALSPLRWPALFGVLALALATLYRLAPSSGREGWPFVTVGGAAAALLLLLTCVLFSWFTGRFASFAVTYGSLSTVVAFLLWLWLSFMIVLCGAELDAAIGAETGLYGGGPANDRGEPDVDGSDR
ncbi:YihY/virulence factor BrkB family protein [Methylorubrum extorquens]|uniref:YihY/virulence factor BrkB family protein n=1 Tax=Methylorubrum extorquens TaxID=408 RepID=UPI002237038D|nr:YihY/virulence factor BrkB family protein [Methylorubrum extorquens]UYW28374.1 YihY/virulence factor BrkB family protein [Methylorubrum extorquens]